MTNYLKKGAQGLLVVFLFSFLGNIFGYISRTILARVLTPAEFGLFYSIFSLAMFLILFAGFGFGEALPKFMAECIAKNQKEKLRRIILYTTLFRLALAMAISTGLALSASFLAQQYYKTEEALPVIYVFCLIFPFLLFARALYNTLQGYQETFWLGLLGFAEKFMFVVFIVIGLLIFPDRSALFAAYSFLTGIAMTVIIFIPVVLKKTLRYARGSEKIGRELLAKMAKFAVAAVFGSIGYLLIGYTDTLMLTYFVDLAEVGIYNTVLPTMLVLSFFTKTIQSVFLPMSSELWTKQLKDKLSDGLGLLQKYSLFIVVPVAMTTIFYPDLILGILFGQKYVTGAAAMQLLSLAIIFYTLGTIYQATLSGMGFPKEVTVIVFIAAFANVVGNFVLIPLYGIKGAAITTTVSYFMIMGLTQMRLRKRVDVAFGAKELVKFVGAATVYVLIISGLKMVLELPVIFEAIITLICGLGIYILVCFVLGVITKKEITKLLTTVFSRSPSPEQTTTD